tara:strand:+ start:203 stop:505 length:303 start_codon:yes stop_codon:yes gene_type:complete
MKLLKLSLLINYFAIAKNSKRAIFLINVGLFLSIFALSAASISIYVENKVSNLEFEHLTNSRAKSEPEQTTQEEAQSETSQEDTQSEKTDSSNNNDENNR